MHKKFVFPDWHKLSTEEKEMIQNWLKSILYARTTTTALLEHFTHKQLDHEQESNNINNLNINLPIDNFDVHTNSADASAEFINLTTDNILPQNNNTIFTIFNCTDVCSKLFPDDQNQYNKCLKSCRRIVNEIPPTE